MSVLADDLFFYGSVNMPETDVDTVGGLIDIGTKVVFTDVDPAGAMQIVSSSSSDSTQSVTITYRNSAGVRLTETKLLNGRNSGPLHRHQHRAPAQGDQIRPPRPERSKRRPASWRSRR